MSVLNAGFLASLLFVIILGMDSSDHNDLPALFELRKLCFVHSFHKVFQIDRRRRKWIASRS